ncbi:hypothetical protein [Aurantiacibacter spongiae]|uniref:hypothetical protein n=1 Tax=Aurantiacibacter spongiae TaxID=2488860 RepID=UPI001F290F85|nr:hypothetical protein [Aurantiacibacter spongiae]
MIRRKWPDPPRTDSHAITLLAIAALFLAARTWLTDHPQHDPTAPLDLRDPRGWTTEGKLASLAEDPAQCRQVLDRSAVSFEPLPATGEGNVVASTG